MPVAQGDIYWVDVPGTVGSEQAGCRPYIIVSRLAINRSHPTVIGVPMTTKVNKANSYRILIPLGEIVKDASCTATLQNSVALCDHVRVIDQTLLRGKIGRLSQTAILSVGVGLGFIFDLR
jgi:mRNA interferase MazF